MVIIAEGQSPVQQESEKGEAVVIAHPHQPQAVQPHGFTVIAKLSPAPRYEAKECPDDVLS